MKTAVEFLMEKLQSQGLLPYIEEINELVAFREALTMEKEQIDDAYDSGWYDGSQEDPENRVYKDYYNETFKSVEQ